MIAVDTSALVAIFLTEPGYLDLVRAIDASDEAVLSTVSRFEAMSVLCGRRVGAAPQAVETFIDDLDLRLEPASEEHMQAAIRALLRYGRGRHRAALNLGDCFSYALARVLNVPLLFVGNDFVLTDLVPVIPPRGVSDPS